MMSLSTSQKYIIITTIIIIVVAIIVGPDITSRAWAQSINLHQIVIIVVAFALLVLLLLLQWFLYEHPNCKPGQITALRFEPGVGVEVRVRSRGMPPLKSN